VKLELLQKLTIRLMLFGRNKSKITLSADHLYLHDSVLAVP
jgi:hypothetical protein